MRTWRMTFNPKKQKDSVFCQYFLTNTTDAPQHQAVILLILEQHLEVQQVPHRQQRKLPYPYHLVAHQQQEAGSQVMRSSLLEIHTDMVETA